MLHALILAGGAGTRFWPESRARQPKQFLRLGDEKSMLRATVDRLGNLVEGDRVWVATTNPLAGQVIEQLPEVPLRSMIVEPCSRNTAPCIGLAALYMLHRDPEATMIVLPTDHTIDPPPAFRDAIRLAVDMVEEDPDWMVTFGIRPDHPAETYGYIERGERFQPTALALGLTTAEAEPASGLQVYHVRQFCEKPTVERARQFLNRGTFLWNSGIFVWKAQTILAALGHREPALHQRLVRIHDAIGTENYIEVLRREFVGMPSISIDHAVMEHAEDVLVVEAPFAWDDLVGWQALQRLLGVDADGNTVAAKHVGLNTAGTIIRSTDDHLIATTGLKDLIIIHTPDATLVANKHDEQSVRQLVELLQQRGWTEYL